MVPLGIFSVVSSDKTMSTRDFSWGKGDRCVWLTTYHPCNAESRDYPGPQPTRDPLGHLGLSPDTFTLLYQVILCRFCDRPKYPDLYLTILIHNFIILIKAIFQEIKKIILTLIKISVTKSNKISKIHITYLLVLHYKTTNISFFSPKYTI